MDIPTTSDPLVNDTLTRVALLRLLTFADTTPSPYDLARAFVTTGLLLPQEAKGAYVNGLARVSLEEETDPGDWRTFRNKLQALLLKAHALVHAADMLLQDWQIREPAVKQLGLFAQGRTRSAVDRTTGEEHE